MKGKARLKAAIAALIMGLFFAGPLMAQPLNMSRTGQDSKAAGQTPESVNEDGKMPNAEFPETKWTFTRALDGDEISHTFKVRNTGEGLLKIHKVHTG